MGGALDAEVGVGEAARRCSLRRCQLPMHEGAPIAGGGLGRFERSSSSCSNLVSIFLREVPERRADCEPPIKRETRRREADGRADEGMWATARVEGRGNVNVRVWRSG